MGPEVVPAGFGGQAELVPIEEAARRLPAWQQQRRRRAEQQQGQARQEQEQQEQGEVTGQTRQQQWTAQQDLAGSGSSSLQGLDTAVAPLGERAAARGLSVEVLATASVRPIP